MTYSPAMIDGGIGPEGWLKLIKKKMGENYLTEEQEQLLLREGIQALLPTLPEEDK